MLPCPGYRCHRVGLSAGTTRPGFNPRPSCVFFLDLDPSLLGIGMGAGLLLRPNPT